ncbi:ABC transporter ATP-binding protein [Microbacterium sp. H1-D42]|uniref:ABC transporter ATP-binding protein n=1 Tax=Microbacterium sp. H1-D42 TaxID=2925844 RepID=UPI001F5368F0|nr:ABC transporter ATP-binding protein [Microbacterium sp. H1-D42]UNK70920.1 ABC transporter ATP-binding protein [Microbacterium sp. H1-D42]
MSASAGLDARRVALTRAGRLIVDGVDVSAPDGAVTALVGPNGAGKSTLLQLIAGILSPDGGDIHFDGANLHRMPRRERARRLALVEQEWGDVDGLTARELVDMGRMPHQKWLAAASTADEAIVDDAIVRAGAAELADRSAGTLSGGERQRVNLARALAQQPQLLLCDEPTNHLDVHAQLSTLALLRSLSRDGMTVIAALHDLNHAAQFADHVVVIAGGVVQVAGPPAAVLTPDWLRAVWRVEADVIAHNGHPLIVFEGPVADRDAGQSRTFGRSSLEPEEGSSADLLR